MDEYSDLSGIICNDVHAKEVGTSFGKHFSERSPNIEELSLQAQTPNVARHAGSIRCEKPANTLAPPKNQLMAEKKWPQNENTHLLGDVDIDKWPKYRPNNERPLNFTELIEDKTVYERSQLLRNGHLPVVNDIDMSSQSYFSCQSQLFCETNATMRPESSAVVRTQKSDNNDAMEIFFGELNSRAYHLTSKNPLAQIASDDISCAVQHTNNQMVQKLPFIHQQFTYHDGKFPLKANTCALIWECVALGAATTKSFRIKNTSDKWLPVKGEVIGNGFEMFADDEGTIVLKGNEVRTIHVTFKPKIVGKSLGSVIFKPAGHWLDETERKIYLCAYGGETDLYVQHIESNGPNVSLFLRSAVPNCMTPTLTTLKGHFSICNRGSVNGFAMVFIKPDPNHLVNECQIFIEPRRCIIPVNGSSSITVTYQLQRKDVDKLQLKAKYLQAPTVDTLIMIYGSEANCQRISSVLANNSESSLHEKYGFLDRFLKDLRINSLATEMEDFSDMRDDINNVSNLFDTFQKCYIKLQVSRSDLNATENGYLTCHNRTFMDYPR